MKSKIYFSIAAIAIITFSFKASAQIDKTIPIDYKISNPYKVIDGIKKLYAGDNGKMLAVKYFGKGISIQTFDATSMNELTRTEYKDFQKPFLIDELVQLGDQFFLFYSIKNKTTKEYDLFSREISIETGKFITEQKLLISPTGKTVDYFSLNNIEFGTFTMILPIQHYQYTLNHEKNKVAVTYSYAKEDNNLCLAIFDNKMIPVSERKFTLPHNEKYSDILNYALFSDNVFYILYREFQNEKHSFVTKDNKLNYKLMLYKATDESNDLTSQEVILEDHFIADVVLEDDNGTLLCAGTYATDNAKWRKTSGLIMRSTGLIPTPTLNLSVGKNPSQPHNIDVDVDGVFSFDIARNGQVSKIDTAEIPVKLLNYYVSKLVAKTHDKIDEDDKLGFSDLKLRDVYATPDSGRVIVCEQFYISTRTVYTNTGTVVKYAYHYLDMLFAKFDSKGELEFIKKLPKNQFAELNAINNASYKGGLSYKYEQTEKYHYIFFLDNVKNLDLDMNHRAYRHVQGEGGYFTCYRIDNKTGEVAKGSIFDMRDMNGGKPIIKGEQFTTNRILKIGDNKLILELYTNKKEDRLVEITLE